MGTCSMHKKLPKERGRKEKTWKQFNIYLKKQLRSYHRWCIPQIHGECELTHIFNEDKQQISEKYVFLNIGQIIKKKTIHDIDVLSRILQSEKNKYLLMIAVR